MQSLVFVLEHLRKNLLLILLAFLLCCNFVMPVTARLLNEPNRALDVEFKYAIKNGISILPLLTEPGLEETFNKVCGTLHCLRLFEETAYLENLKKFLDEIFGKDFIDKRIHKEFDASIFLSYRKVDKEYLPSLIHKIHSSDSCRDVAIWYDDFLSPGEDFNLAIQKALRRSDVFLLAITPHLLDKNAKRGIRTKRSSLSAWRQFLKRSWKARSTTVLCPIMLT